MAKETQIHKYLQELHQKIALSIEEIQNNQGMPNMGGGGGMFPSMDDVADKLQALEDTNKLLQNELQKLEAQSRTDKSSIEQMEAHLRDAQDRVKHEKEKMKTRYDNLNEKYQNETGQLRQENDFLRQTLESQKDTVEKNERKMKEVMEENADLSMIKKDLIMNHMKELESLHNRIAQANKQIEEQSKMLSVSKSERQNKENVYHDEIVQLKKDNDAFIKEIQNQRIALDKLESQNRELQQQVGNLQAEKNKLQEDFETNIAIERSSVTGEKEKHDNELRELEEQYKNKMQEDRDHFEQTLENELARIKKEYKEEQLKDRDHFETTLEAEINRIKKEASDQQMKDRDLFETTLEKEICRIKEECEEEKRKFISDFDSKETDYDSKLRNAQQLCLERNKELETMRQSLVNKEKEFNERMRMEMVKRDDEIRRLNECRIELDRRMQDKEGVMKEREKEMHQMKMKFQDMLRQSEENCLRCGTNVRQDKNKMRSIRVQTEGNSNQVKPARVFMAKYSYNPKVSSPNEYPETELMFRAGDYILMEEAVDEDGYFFGRLLSGEEGYVPFPFVEKVAEYLPPNYKTKS